MTVKCLVASKAAITCIFSQFKKKVKFTQHPQGSNSISATTPSAGPNASLHYFSEGLSQQQPGVT